MRAKILQRYGEAKEVVGVGRIMLRAWLEEREHARRALRTGEPLPTYEQLFGVDPQPPAPRTAEALRERLKNAKSIEEKMKILDEAADYALGRTGT